MPKSKIIKELANGSVDTITALKRTKVLLSEFDNEELNTWVSYEITGYPDEAEIPDYRIVRGNLMGSYFKGSMASHMTWTHVSIPLGKMPEDLKDLLLTVYFREGVDALRQLAEKCNTSDNNLGKTIGADFFPAIAHYNNDPYMMITSARVEIADQCINNVFSNIENRLLEILMFLEKEFGVLDDLDIDVDSKSDKEKEKIVKQLHVIIFNDNRVSIGDGNRIKDSNIASSIE
jgi:hypothetical protein